jgi:competence protein ComEC
MPLGLDSPWWWLMGRGIDWMISVAQWVAGIPGALGRLAAFEPGPLLICTLGLALLCLLRTPLRFFGSLLVVGAAVMMISAPQPDVLVSGDAGAFAVRNREGRLAMIRSGSDAFTLRAWLAADADPRSPTDASLGEGIGCDAAGCVGRLGDGTPIALARSIEAFAEDCRRAAVVISARKAPPGCAAIVIDRSVLQRSGAMALRRVGQGFELAAARPPGYDRPWAPAISAGGESGDPGTAARRAPERDATLRQEDLEPGD